MPPRNARRWRKPRPNDPRFEEWPMRMNHQRIARLDVEALEVRNVPATFGVPWPDARHLTLSFVPDGTRVGAGVSNLFAHMNEQAAPDVWKNAILSAFQTWA